MQITNISDAKASLSRLIERLQNTDDVVIIGKAGKPVAILSAFKANHATRKLGGSWEGKVNIPEGMDDEMTEAWVNAFYDNDIIPKSDKTP
ncbi:MAG: type II toxin-antitoxin system Phd/YefM family antitoxin [Nitrospirota bacterium]|nr:type II toxin-antitoxin system Phd/YefM family antitoxin [Nitrospirota bacterium]